MAQPPEATPMLDEILDNEPVQSQFVQFLSSRLDARDARPLADRRPGHWHEHTGLWTRRHDLAHWIERGREAG
jgi:hypothetical protein